jgi:hypothetical protein
MFASVRFIALPAPDGGSIAPASTFAAIRPAPMILFVLIFDLALQANSLR